jgi:hypothetical protein
LIDLQTAITASSLGFATVWKNADDRDYTFENMPLLDLRFKEARPQALAAGQYYVEVDVEAEIAAFDMTGRDKCATIRDNLTNALQQWVRTHPKFGASIDTTLLGKVVFDVGETKAQGPFVAAALVYFTFLQYAG